MLNPIIVKYLSQRVQSQIPTADKLGCITTLRCIGLDEENNCWAFLEDCLEIETDMGAAISDPVWRDFQLIRKAE